MSLLETLDDDIADLLGSDNEESFSNAPVKPSIKRNIFRTKQINAERVTKSEKKTVPDKSIVATRRRKKMLHSQSNQSLRSTNTDASDSVQVSMSREEALSLLQSESLKALHEHKESVTPRVSNNNMDLTSNPKDPKYPEANREHGMVQDVDTLLSPMVSKSKHSSKSTSDDDSNDSILDWLDEPPVMVTSTTTTTGGTQSVHKRQPMHMLPQQSTNNEPDHEAVAVTKPKNNNISDPINGKSGGDYDQVMEQWTEWLELNEEDIANPLIKRLLDRVMEMKLPSNWEKVNDNLYHNIRTNQRQMTHPLLEQMQTELHSIKTQNTVNQETEDREQVRDHNESNSKQDRTLKSTLGTTQTTSLSSLTVNTQIPSAMNVNINTMNVPSRQIDSAMNVQLQPHSQSQTLHSLPAATGSNHKVHSVTTQISKLSLNDKKVVNDTVSVVTQEVTDELSTSYKREAESLVIKNLRMELAETRVTLSRLMKDKTRLMEEAEEAQNKMEILLGEQRQRLIQSHNMDTKQLQTEINELRALNSKLMSQHQAELLHLESSIRAGESKQKQRAINELTLSEQRGREELSHQMELHRQTVDELKLQHQNEIEMLHSMHQKQLSALREHNKSEGQLDLLITKMESSTQSLNQIKRDLVMDREQSHTQRESKIEEKERILTEKDEELLKERKAHRELLERWQSLVEETKLEKVRIREQEDALKRREEQMVCDLSDGNRELNLQRDQFNEERRKFQLHQSRWEKLKQDEMDDIHRLKTDHTNSVHAFYEEQELERSRLAKQRQIMAEDKTRFLNSRQRLEAERESLDDKLLSLEEKRHSLEMERSTFERKVQDVSAMSRRVHQQSEMVTKMYAESRVLEEENNTVQMELTAQSKELKVMKQQLLMEKHHIEKERALLEQEQLSLLTTKRDMMQHLDTMKAMEHRQQTANNILRANTAKENVMEVPLSNEQTVYRSDRRTTRRNRENINMNKIQSELRLLKDFVDGSSESLSMHRHDVRALRLKREEYRNSPKEHMIDCSKSARFNTLKMSFPSFVSKSGSYTNAQSMQSSRTRSVRSLTSTLSSRHGTGTRERQSMREEELLEDFRIGLGKTVPSRDIDESAIDNLSKIEVPDDLQNHDITKTPVIGGKSRNHLGAFNVTDDTLGGTFVSMANIDTPITVDNKSKTRKRIDRILEDSTLPMTPTKMPNLSEINVTEADNEDVVSVNDDLNSFDVSDEDEREDDENNTLH